MKIIEKFKNQNKFIFLFLFIFCFLLNPVEVKAERIDTQGISTESVKNLQAAGEKDIVAISDNYYVGLTEGIMEIVNYYSGGEYFELDGMSFIEYADSWGFKYGREVVTYPTCMIFEERTRNTNGSKALDSDVRSTHYNTSWLYLYCDSNRYYEWMNNRERVGFENIPKVYSIDGEESAIVIIPAYYFYAPISSMTVDSSDSSGNTVVYSQLYHGDGNAKDAIDYAFSHSQRTHYIHNFSGLYGKSVSYNKSYDIALDLYGNEILNSQDSWIMNFLVAANIENGHMSEGQSYGDSRYPLEWQTVKNTVNKYPYLSNYIDEEYLSSISLNKCRAFKTETNSLGLDKLYGGSGMKLPNGEWGTLMNVPGIISSMYKMLDNPDDNSTNYGESITINEENFHDLYNNSAWIAEDGIPGCFVSSPAGDGMVRYVWAANATQCMASATLFFAKDQGGAYNVSTYDIDFEKNGFTNHTALQNYPTYGNTSWNSLTEADQIVSVLTVIQDIPSLGVRLINEVDSSLGSGLNAIKALNNLGKTNFEKWKRTVVSMGNVLFNGCPISACGSTGWSVSIGLKHNNDVNYSGLSVGISISKEIKTLASDLVVSNSYNTKPFDGEISGYNPSGRAVIDWMHGGSASYSGLNDFQPYTVGGTTALSELVNSQVDKSSTWEQYDINSKIIWNGGTALALAKGDANTMEIESSNLELAKAYERNSEDIVYKTIAFVGRTPESDPKLKVSTSDFKLLATPIYNNFNAVNFDPSLDINYSSRMSMHTASKDGSAAETLQGYFNMFQTSYNTNILFNVYKSDMPYDYRSTTFQSIKGMLCAKQELDPESLKNYKPEDYIDNGANTTGYSGLKPLTGSFETAVEGTEMKPGDVVAYAFNYKIPNDNTIKNELAKNATTLASAMSILTEGDWYTSYGTIMMVDLNFDLVPAHDSLENWSKINSNTKNDFNRMRIIPPVMKNIFFTDAEVYLDGNKYANYSPSVKTLDGMPYTLGNGSTREASFTVPAEAILAGNTGGTDDYSADNVYLNVNWRFWSRGIQASEVPIDSYNYVDYSNSFSQQSSSTANYNDGSKVNGYRTGWTPFEGFYEVSLKPDPKLELNFNTSILNSSKIKTISASVPQNSSNQYRQDWEIVDLTIEVPTKDNAAVDMVLVDSGGNIIGDQNVKRGGSQDIQMVNQKYANTTLYCVVQRVEPNIKFDEFGKGFNFAGENIGKLELTLNGNKEGTIYLNSNKLITSSIPGYIGKSISNFVNPGDFLVFKHSFSGEVKSLDAHFSYRNDSTINYDFEDSEIANNSWYESWICSEYPDFTLDITDGTADITEYIDYEPWVNITVKQVNEFYTQVANTYVKAYMQRMTSSAAAPMMYPEKVEGNVQYLGTGQIAVSLNGVDEQSFRVVWKQKKLYDEYKNRLDAKCNNKPYMGDLGIDSVNNLNVVVADINRTHVTHNNEIIKDNNSDKHKWNERFPQITCPTTIIVCDTLNPVNGCKNVVPLGQKYNWDVKFKWTQSSADRTAARNVYKHTFGCDCPSIYTYVPTFDPITGEQNGQEKILVQRIIHEHCNCYCMNQGNAQNNNVSAWRNRDLHLGMYWEYHDLKIKINTSSKGIRDITNGRAVVYNDEEMRFWFEAIYESNRNEEPDSPKYPFDQPYVEYGGGLGCHPCNILSRTSGLTDVAGPKEVVIKISGSKTLSGTFHFKNPSSPIKNGLVSKHYRFDTMDTAIVIPKDTVMQVIHLSLKSQLFRGHYTDSTNTPDGNNAYIPAYAWKNRLNMCFCGEVTAEIVIVGPSKYLLGSELPLGMDSNNSSNADGNTGVVDLDEDTWMY